MTHYGTFWPAVGLCSCHCQGPRCLTDFTQLASGMWTVISPWWHEPGHNVLHKVQLPVQAEVVKQRHLQGGQTEAMDLALRHNN